MRDDMEFLSFDILAKFCIFNSKIKNLLVGLGVELQMNEYRSWVRLGPRTRPEPEHKRSE
jgi:hypothetical protein